MNSDNRWLKIRNLEAWRNNKRIFTNLSLDLYYGQNVVILGPNGSGKSSLLNLINRTLYPKVTKNSEIKIFEKTEINIWNLRNRIGFLLEEIDKRVDSNTNVNDLILSGFQGNFKIKNEGSLSPEKQDSLAKIINQMDLQKIITKTYRTLSDGQKRRVLIARALIHNPKILILDEPTNNLDFKSTCNLLKILEEICNRQISLVQVTHNVDTIIKSINRVILMKNGTIVDDGSPTQILTSDKLSELYETELKVVNSNGFWRLVPRI